MKILVVGAGYVGLVTGACFASQGQNVVCVDNNQEKIAALRSAQVPFYEPGLDDLVRAGVQSGALKFSDSLRDNLNQADVVFICVGTPPKENGQADLKYVYKIAQEIGEQMHKYLVVVTKSTVPVGTGQKVKKIIQQFYPGDFDVASCPEFLREGSAIQDFSSPDRIVIGTESARAFSVLSQVHQNFACPKINTNIQTAEMIKYASNAFLATKISFINEIANVCENVGADVQQVAEGMGYDKRIGRAFLNAGIGYGGSCFPKDVRALHHIAGQMGYPFQLLKAVIEVNNQQRWLFYKKIKEKLGGMENKVIGVWGLAFKPNTDDVRESIALDLIEKLVEDGAKVRAYDPQAMKNARQVLGEKITYCDSAVSAAQDADCLLLITEWDEFKEINLPELKLKMKTPIVFDGRNVFDKKYLQELGYDAN